MYTDLYDLYVDMSGLRTILHRKRVRHQHSASALAICTRHLHLPSAFANISCLTSPRHHPLALFYIFGGGKGAPFLRGFLSCA